MLKELTFDEMHHVAGGVDCSAAGYAKAAGGGAVGGAVTGAVAGAITGPGAAVGAAVGGGAGAIGGLARQAFMCMTSSKDD